MYVTRQNTDGSRLGSLTQLALGYALERIGLLEEARQAYQATLILDDRNRRARQRLESLRLRQLPADTTVTDFVPTRTFRSLRH